MGEENALTGRKNLEWQSDGEKWIDLHGGKDRVVSPLEKTYRSSRKERKDTCYLWGKRSGRKEVLRTPRDCEHCTEIGGDRRERGPPSEI